MKNSLTYLCGEEDVIKEVKKIAIVGTCNKNEQLQIVEENI